MQMSVKGQTAGEGERVLPPAPGKMINFRWARGSQLTWLSRLPLPHHLCDTSTLIFQFSLSPRQQEPHISGRDR